MWLLPVIAGLLYAWAGWTAAHKPQALSGFDLLPRRLRERSDIRALGRYCARLLYLCAALSLAGAALLPLLPPEALAVVLCLPLAVLSAGWVWGRIRYDRKFLKP